MKAYFNYLVKTKWLQTVVLALIPTFIFALFLILNNVTYSFQNSNRLPDDFSLSVIFISVVLIVIVVFRFSSLRNPKEVDLYYALPISRKKLFLTHSLFGQLCISLDLSFS
jgi:acetoin utilization transport system permease protein